MRGLRLLRSGRLLRGRLRKNGRGAERKAWGILGKPPEGLTTCHPDLVRRWKKLAEEARVIMRMKPGPTKLARAKDIERNRAYLIRDIELNAKLLKP